MEALHLDNSLYPCIQKLRCACFRSLTPLAEGFDWACPDRVLQGLRLRYGIEAWVSRNGYYSSEFLVSFVVYYTRKRCQGRHVRLSGTGFLEKDGLRTQCPPECSGENLACPQSLREGWELC